MMGATKKNAVTTVSLQLKPDHNQFVYHIFQIKINHQTEYSS